MKKKENIYLFIENKIKENYVTCKNTNSLNKPCKKDISYLVKLSNIFGKENLIFRKVGNKIKAHFLINESFNEKELNNYLSSKKIPKKKMNYISSGNYFQLNTGNIAVYLHQ